MTIYSHERWNGLLRHTIERITKLSIEKGGEYAGDIDRLANFRRNGADVGLPMETIWRVYAGKHWDAITQYVKDLQSGKDRVRSEPIEGRVHDLIVYSILLLAMIEERNTAALEEIDRASKFSYSDFLYADHPQYRSGVEVVEPKLTDEVYQKRTMGMPNAYSVFDPVTGRRDDTTPNTLQDGQEPIRPYTDPLHG